MKTSSSPTAKTLISLFALSTFAFANAADLDSEVDSKIAGMVKAILENHSTDNRTNQEMIDYMDKACKNPELLTAKLRKASEVGLGIADSPDKKIRVFSWDCGGGGTMHFIHSIAQYEVPGSKQTSVIKLHPKDPPKDHDDPDPGWFFSSIDPIQTVDGKTVYLIMGDGTFDRFSFGITVEAYSIEGGKLVKTPFFKTTKSLLDSISCEFKGEHVSATAIQLADNKTTLKIPLLKADYTPTGKYLVYKFDGHKFVYIPAK